MLFPTLYKRTSTGAIQQWTIEVVGNGYRTISGQVDGIKTISSWTTCYGKNIGKINETSNVQQALADATAKITKQKDKGYTENINDVDISVTYFKPQLAKEWTSRNIDITTGAYCSPKLDGMRSPVRVDGMWSRNGKPIVSAPHIIDELKDLYIQFPDLILDGELYCDNLADDFNAIMSMAKKTKPTNEDLKLNAKYLQFHIFDIPSLNRPFRDRRKYIAEVIEPLFKDSNCVKFVEHTYINTEEEFKRLFALYIEQGYEGLMVNMPDALYENKRSNGLLKYKEFMDEEFILLDIIEGDGKRANSFGRARLLLNDGSGRTFDSNSRGTEAYYDEIYLNKHLYIGKKANIRFQNYTPDGVPRFPVMTSIRDYE